MRTSLDMGCFESSCMLKHSGLLVVEPTTTTIPSTTPVKISTRSHPNHRPGRPDRVLAVPHEAVFVTDRDRAELKAKSLRDTVVPQTDASAYEEILRSIRDIASRRVARDFPP